MGGTLAVAEGLHAPVPALDPVEWLTMADMMGNMNHGNTGGHSGMAHDAADHSSMDHSQHGAMAIDHSQHGPAVPYAKASTTVRHASTEYGPSVDMRVDMPRTNLDDPGIGLRNTGRRALTLADLHSLDGIIESGGPEAEIELHLTGNMERYTWSFDGLEFSKSTPVHMKHNQRIRVI